METGVKDSTCPHRGHRAPELAAGRGQRMLEDLAGQCLGLLLQKTAHVAQEERNFVVHDWEAGRTKIMEVFEAKLAHWAHLPHKLCGMGCADFLGTRFDTARACVKSRLQMWEHLSAEQREDTWPMVQLVCHPASRLRTEVIDFIDEKADLDELPGLKWVAGVM
eukprot:8517608-Pyramimonas_sp.AAC.1